MKNQNSAYRQPGVALSDSALQPYQAYWQETDDVEGMIRGYPGPPTCEVQIGPPSPKYLDCVSAVAGLQDQASVTIPRLGAGKTWDVNTVGTCTVQVQYAVDWSKNSKCVFQMPWVMDAAQSLLDVCESNGLIGGFQKMDIEDELGCSAAVWLFRQ